MELTLADFRAAHAVVRRHLAPTPLGGYPLLDRAAGATVLVKHENAQPVGAFKVRGGLTLLDALPAADRARGTLTWSTGNHAQSLAYASHRYGVPCTVVMPAGTDPGRAAAVEAWGARVVLAGDRLEDAQEHAGKLAAETGALAVSPGDTPELLAGVGTLYLEILEREPDLDAIVVPVGSGTGAAAACLVSAALGARCAVIGVQSAASPAAHDSWRAGELLARPNRSTVAGLATGRGYALPQRVMRAGLADFLLVGDDEIGAARRLLASAAHTLAEGAGAAALAGVLSRPDLFAGRRIAVVCSGGNADRAELGTMIDGRG
ncbi:threonine dehydratase [Actinoplanes sp. SE50]|uniref:threonine ammonia-lyase n=1 Tax=unclassified Actinoplanes TaxID=2626549 RepID=UPI00023EC525|nr:MULTISPECIES: pyridoxal-phosphate dependent enzyme [unclassified Actinoplanes]AEV88040.1 threonine dehydratase [Actinoplanes sp. SE50/110]ATO86444.1 threonine dehydratase [Actinoplanes sp. SE50]SLM03859.1 threonine dehydratase [Actinoplanes sp. SE50/110]